MHLLATRPALFCYGSRGDLGCPAGELDELRTLIALLMGITAIAGIWTMGRERA